MKLLALLMVCAVAAAAPSQQSEKIEVFHNLEIPQDVTPAGRNILLNTLIRQLWTFLRLFINNGSVLLRLPPLDPLDLERLHLEIPALLLNLDLELENVFVTGLGGFVVHRGNINTRGDLTFDIDISFPRLDIRAGRYALDGDLFTAIPLYGDGEAIFTVENFRFQALLHLKQSEDGRSVLIDRIERAAFQLPSFKSDLSGVIGGGGIDKIVNAVIEDVIIDYVNRFQGAISRIAASVITTIGNPILDRLDTWIFIAPFV